MCDLNAIAKTYCYYEYLGSISHGVVELAVDNYEWSITAVTGSAVLASGSENTLEKCLVTMKEITLFWSGK